MNNNIKGMCLFLGVIGLGYVTLLILITLLTGVKLFKSIMFISIFSSFLISLGLTQQVKVRLFNYLRSLTTSQFF